MFCTECICHHCPYGLRCRDCDTWLDGHILLIEGCNGQKKTDECLFDYIAHKETEVPEHAEMLREIVRNKDLKAMDVFFDYKTGPYHQKDRERFEKWQREQKENSYEND